MPAGLPQNARDWASRGDQAPMALPATCCEAPCIATQPQRSASKPPALLPPSARPLSSPRRRGARRIVDRRPQAAPGSSDAMAAQAAEAVPAAGAPAESEVSFVNRRGERLWGVFVDTGSPEVAILCHGYVANHSMCQFPLLAAELAKAGISSLRFDHPCAIYTKSERRGPFLMGNHEEEVADMRDAVEWVRAELGRQVACLLGHSKGGINVVLFASRYHDVPKVVNLAGRFKCREGTLARFGADILDRLAAEKAIPRKEAWGEWVMTEQDFLNRCNLDTEKLARSIPPSVRMLCLHGTGDKTIPYQESELCASLVPSSQLVLVQGADHNFSSPEAGRELAARVVEFVLS